MSTYLHHIYHINLFNNIVLNFSSVDVIFKDNYFDYAIVNSMFEYLKDYEEVKKSVDELERVSKKGVFIANIREFTHNKKLDKHKFDGVFTHLTLERSFFIEKGYTLIDCYHNDKQRYNQLLYIKKSLIFIFIRWCLFFSQC